MLSVFLAWLIRLFFSLLHRRSLRAATAARGGWGPGGVCGAGSRQCMHVRRRPWAHRFLRFNGSERQ